MARRPADACYARVQPDGTFVLADEISAAVMRRKKIRRGALVRLWVGMPRDYGQWKKAHQLGTFVAQNLDEFQRFQLENGRVDAHGALKHLQVLSGIECDESRLTLGDGQDVLVRTPRSLAFDEMDEGQFQACYSGMCQYVINRWWPDMEEWQIEEAASLVGLSG